MIYNPGDDSLLERGDSSPVRDSDHLSGFTVEGKKTEAKSIDDLRYQLFANMIVSCVGHFIDKCKTPQCNEDLIQNADRLI